MASNESKDVSCQTVDNLTLINEEEIMGLVSLLSTLANLFLHNSYCFILFDLEITVNGNLILDLISETVKHHETEYMESALMIIKWVLKTFGQVVLKNIAEPRSEELMYLSGINNSEASEKLAKLDSRAVENIQDTISKSKGFIGKYEGGEKLLDGLLHKHLTLLYDSQSVGDYSYFRSLM